jgi:hypothetical protein
LPNISSYKKPNDDNNNNNEDDEEKEDNYDEELTRDTILKSLLKIQITKNSNSNQSQK